MRKQYIIPATIAQTVCQVNAICVGSIHGTESITYGGEADPENPNQKPF